MISTRCKGNTAPLCQGQCRGEGSGVVPYFLPEMGFHGVELPRGRELQLAGPAVALCHFLQLQPCGR